jgi:hypothetical protein
MEFHAAEAEERGRRDGLAHRRTALRLRDDAETRKLARMKDWLSFCALLAAYAVVFVLAVVAVATNAFGTEVRSWALSVLALLLTNSVAYLAGKAKGENRG